MFIDPPSPFASREEWQNFLEEMLKLPESPEVNEAIRQARETIAKKDQDAEAS